MTDLVDGAKVPWHIVSGKQDLESPQPRRSELPDPARREPARELSAQVAANTLANSMQACESEISKLKTAIVAVGHDVKAHALEQLESRRRWIRSVTESLKEHR